MSRPRLLDLFCGAGGAGMGYHRAGFDVVGIDINPQPRYPFEFHQDDALTFPLDGFDVIHASPPCQAHSSLRFLHRTDHADLLTPTRERLQETETPWVIENVPGAPMRPDVVLCGTQFGLGVWRHRWFEFWVPPAHLVPPCVHVGHPIGVYGHPGGRSSASLHRNTGDPNPPQSKHRNSSAEWREAMAIDWMLNRELAQAIPPAYTEWIGAQLLAHIGASA